jgi:hypothetical protein
MTIAPRRCQFLRHSWCHKSDPDSLELSGVVILAQEEKTRLYSELIAGTARKSKAIFTN